METHDHDTFTRAWMTPEEYEEWCLEFILEYGHLLTSVEEELDSEQAN